MYLAFNNCEFSFLCGVMLNSGKIIIGLEKTTGIPPNRGYYEVIYTVIEQWIGACLTELLNNRLLLQNGNFKKISLAQLQKKRKKRILKPFVIIMPEVICWILFPL